MGAPPAANDSEAGRFCFGPEANPIRAHGEIRPAESTRLEEMREERGCALFVALCFFAPLLARFVSVIGVRFSRPPSIREAPRLQ